MDLTESPLERVTRHPWERTRARFFLDRIRAAYPPGTTFGSVLDLGAGDAFFSDLVARSFSGARVTSVDIGYGAATRARLTRLYPSVEFAQEVPAGQRFDLVVALDVIEHVEDDLALLRRIVGDWLAAGGTVVLSVPAHPWLWSSHDVGLRHHRRYGSRAFAQVVARAGLELVERGGLFSSLLLPRAVAVGLERLGARPQAPLSEGAIAWDGSAWLTRIAMSTLGADAWFCAQAASVGITVPGLSCWGVARAAREAA